MFMDTQRRLEQAYNVGVIRSEMIDVSGRSLPPREFNEAEREQFRRGYNKEPYGYTSSGSQPGPNSAL